LVIVVEMVNVTIKSFWLSGWGVAPKEYIVANQFPMIYLSKPETSKDLVSKIENASITIVSKNLPNYLIKSGKASELISKWG